MEKLLISDIVQQTNICSVRQGVTNTMKILNIHMIWNHQILKIMIVSIKERTYLKIERFQLIQWVAILDCNGGSCMEIIGQLVAGNNFD